MKTLYVVSYFVYSIIIAIILFKPYLFASKLLGEIGSSFKAIAVGDFWGGGLVTQISILISAQVTFYKSFLIPTTICSLFTLYLVETFYIKWLNWVQIEVASTIHPDRLWNALIEEEKDFQAFIDAVVAKIKNTTELSSSAHAELAKLYIQEKKGNNSLWSFIGVLLFSFVMFILGSVGEGFFQDLLYDPIKPALCGWGIPICKP